MLHLHKTNKHERDKRIRFVEDTHTYFIDEDCSNVVSSTTLIHKYTGKFDADGIAARIVQKCRNHPDPSNKYYKMTKQEIKDLWSNSGKEASELGTAMHEKIELFYNDNEVALLEDEQEFEYFLDFYNDHRDMEIYRTEWFIFADDLRIAGSIDAIFINDDGTLSLYDWKRSKEIKYIAFGNKVMKPPFHHLPDCNYSQYSLQLNLYRRILEDYYGFTIRDMNLVVCHPNNTNYNKIPIQFMNKEIDQLFKERKNNI